MDLRRVLVSVWSYIQNHDDREKMIERLFEEFDDMSDTCSSGYISRIVNVLSGFGGWSLTISWEDQITSNLAGRLNAKLRTLEEDWSKPEKFEKIISHFSSNQEYIRSLLEKQGIDSSWTVRRLTKDEFRAIKGEKKDGRMVLVEDRKINVREVFEKEKEHLIQEFCDKVQEDLITKGTRSYYRMFYMDNIIEIMNEMMKEFTEHITEEKFITLFRNAQAGYEKHFN